MVTETKTNEMVLTPARIMQTGFAFWSSKVLLTAVNMELFTFLSAKPRTAGEIGEKLDLQERGIRDFLDTLVATDFLYREGNDAAARYGNTLESDVFLDKNKPSYIGGILEMANNRLYPFWSHLDEALQTGLPQNEVRGGGKPLFETLYSDEHRLELFINGMAAVQLGNFIAFAREFDFSGYTSHCDIGGAGGDLSIQIAINNPSIQSVSWDLPQVKPIVDRNIRRHKLHDRIQTASGNFFEDSFPKADVITMGNVLHDWSLEEKKMLIRKAYEALPKGGALVVIENVIDDERKQNVFGLLMSLNMLIETYGGFDFTAADFGDWAREAGFAKIKLIHLMGPSSALIAYK